VRKNIAVITIEGVIDEWTVYSVKRRIRAAYEQGADAVVFDVNSPGGQIFACILVSTEIKRSPIPTTVAWVNPWAYSGGAIVSLACKEVVISDGAVLGDAIPIRFDPVAGLETTGVDEREKMAGPVIADLIDSARQNGYDEMMVQGFVRRGVELWLVEHKDTHARLFVTAAQYKAAVGEEPDRLSPTVRSGTGPMDPAKPRTPRANAPPTDTKPERTDFIPAAPDYSPTLAGDVNTALIASGSRSIRPDLNSPEHKGKYTRVEYVSDGSGVLTLHETELLRYRVAAGKIHSDEELRQHFGATNLIRLDENWADHTARFLSIFWVKAFLIVVFLVAMFVEMSHPGLSLPGGIAAICLVALVVPPILAGIAGWWALVAIVLGIALICVELFVTPGVVVIGLIGVLALFAGLVGTFLIGPGTGGGVFPGSGRSTGEIGWAVTTTLIALVIAGILIGVLLRFLPQVPFLNRLVLTSVDSDEETTGSYTPSFGPDNPIRPGMVGVAVTPLRPAGRVQIGERIVDAVADGSFIDAGARVRVLTSGGFRTTVTQEHA
jgi:membrane-bound ClpP family serine protease